MRNAYSPWGELAGLPDLVLRREKPADGLLGEYRHEERLILLDPQMPRHQARSVLCHELRHHEAADLPAASAAQRLKQEYLADSGAARLLIDVRDLGDALVLHDQHRGAVATELRVSLHMVQTRLKHLHPSEWHFLRSLFTGTSAA